MYVYFAAPIDKWYDDDIISKIVQRNQLICIEDNTLVGFYVVVLLYFHRVYTKSNEMRTEVHPFDWSAFFTHSSEWSSLSPLDAYSTTDFTSNNNDKKITTTVEPRIEQREYRRRNVWICGTTWKSNVCVVYAWMFTCILRKCGAVWLLFLECEKSWPVPTIFVERIYF